ncbi:YbjN domain-containing protein [Saxibacter everestensis]|uniref:YbjN domain-containing protein n=1 Tax=Saxibacter everestensis TaxID=2909229 RepID=A0ABY8QVY6_9MICO|nr:YbjN domain-containing protein [Brevibacteriaceae bacterium ZFBP1038]
MTEASVDPAEADGVVRAWAQDAGIDIECTADGSMVVQLPGERKLKTTVAVKIGDYSVRFMAFVIRKPDERHQEFYRWLLERNGRVHGAAFMIDSLGDVFLMAELPKAALTVDVCDQLMGELLSQADGSFNELLTIGFLSSMQREWDWRISRGESTRNLSAFEHLLRRPSENGGGEGE